MQSSGSNVSGSPPTEVHAGGQPQEAAPAYRLLQPANPAAALGMAVNFLMTMPAFAEQRFGEWSRILVGQINRRHFHFAIDRQNRVVGFAGWAVVTREIAEAWVEGRAGFSDGQASSGDCLVFNAWAARSAEVNRFLLEAARMVGRDKDTAYFRRAYKDGRTRPVRLKINRFVSRHIERQKADDVARQAD